VCQRRIRRVEPAGAAIAEQPLELALLEHPESAREIEGAIDDPERAFDGVILGGNDLHRPVGMLHAVRPVARDRVEMGSDCLELQDDFSDAVLDLRVIRHRPGHPDRCLGLEVAIAI